MREKHYSRWRSPVPFQQRFGVQGAERRKGYQLEQKFLIASRRHNLRAARQ